MKINHTVCAACRHHKRRCQPDCPLLPYFPLNKNQQFLKVHKHFGVSNIVKHLKEITNQTQKDIAMETMLFEAEARDRDPVGGCYRILCDLDEQVEFYQKELNKVNDQIRVCKEKCDGDGDGEGGNGGLGSSLAGQDRVSSGIMEFNDCRVKTEENNETNSGSGDGWNSFWDGENGCWCIAEGSSSSSASDVGQNRSFTDMLNAPMENNVKIEQGEETGAGIWTEETMPKIY